MHHGGLIIAGQGRSPAQHDTGAGGRPKALRIAGRNDTPEARLLLEGLHVGGEQLQRLGQNELPRVVAGGGAVPPVRVQHVDGYAVRQPPRRLEAAAGQRSCRPPSLHRHLRSGAINLFTNQMVS